MTEKLIISQLYQLPENLKVEVLHYIEFLKNRYNHQSTEKPHKRKFGSAQGKYTLSADFNAPLEDFNEYM
ncbi:type II toxin-antitoxin system VapB family antitoxin [Spirosoma litoris]